MLRTAIYLLTGHHHATTPFSCTRPFSWRSFARTRQYGAGQAEGKYVGTRPASCRAAFGLLTADQAEPCAYLLRNSGP